MVDVFISYSRRDREFMERLYHSLQEAGFESWVDWEDIPTGSSWRQEIFDGIESATKFVCILSPDWLTSEICHAEFAHARQHNKALIPVVYREAKLEDVGGKWLDKPWEQTARDNWRALQETNWLFFRESDDFSAALEELITALREDQAYARYHANLTSQARRWEADRTNTDHLLRGQLLSEAEQWLEKYKAAPNPPTELHREFVAESRRVENERQSHEIALQKRAANRLRYLVVALVIFSLGAVGLSVFAFLQQQLAVHQAAISQSIALASQARVDLLQERAVLLSLEAIEEYPYTQQAEAALGEAVFNSRLRQVFEQAQNPRWSPDGQQVLTIFETDALLWGLESGQIVNTLHHASEVSWASWSNDGSKVFTIASNMFYAWNVSTGEVLYTLNDFGQIIDTSFSSDNTKVISIHNPSYNCAPNCTYQIILWNLETREQEYVIDLFGTINLVGWSPDETELIISGDNYLSRWDANTGQAIEAFEITTEGQYTTITNLTKNEPLTEITTNSNYPVANWSRDGSRLLITTEDWAASQSSLHYIDMTTGTTIFTFSYPSSIRNPWRWSEQQHNLIWSPDNTSMVRIAADGQTWVWDVVDGNQLASFSGPSGWYQQIAWSPDIKYLAIAGTGQPVTVWDTDSGEEVFSLAGHTGSINRISWSPDGRYIASSAEDQTVRIWTVFGKDSTSFGPELHILNHSEGVFNAHWSPDGEFISTASLDNLVHIWDATSGQHINQFAGHQGEVSSANWNSDGSQIVTTSWDGSAKIWDTQTGIELLTFAAGDFSLGWLWNAAWSPDNTKIATVRENGWVGIWDAVTGDLLDVSLLQGYGGTSIAWSPDGAYLAAAHMGSARIEDSIGGVIWNTATEEIEVILPYAMQSIEWSPDGTIIAAASTNSTARIYDANSGNILATLVGHQAKVRGVDWSPNGKRLATVSDDGTVRVWQIFDENDSVVGYEVLTLSTHESLINSVDWSPDGTRLVTASDDGTARIWRVWQSTEELIDYVHRCCAVRELTANERQTHNLSLADPLPTPKPYATPTRRVIAMPPTPTLHVAIDDLLSQSVTLRNLDTSMNINIPESGINLTGLDNRLQLDWLSDYFYDDFIIGATVQWGPGSYADYCGFMLRGQGNDSFYYASINQNKWLRFAAEQNGEWYRNNSDLFPGIRSGEGETNELAIIAIGDTFAIFINGEYATQYQEDNLQSGQIGIGADTADDSDTSYCIFKDIWAGSLSSTTAWTPTPTVNFTETTATPSATYSQERWTTSTAMRATANKLISDVTATQNAIRDSGTLTATAWTPTPSPRPTATATPLPSSR
ncbi:TIR domain-containing protein [Chloroflexota bacterium]